jgi:hypothetical protein
MTSFDISNNDIKATGCKALAGALKGNQVMKELNLAANSATHGPPGQGIDMSGITALADVIPGMGALTSLNLAANYLGVEGAKIVAEAIVKVTKCVVAVVLVPMYI